MKNGDMPAMPAKIKVPDGGRCTATGYERYEKEVEVTGLTKREYMAGLAMQGLLSNTGTAGSLDKAKDKGQCLLDLVDVSVFVADTLLAILGENECTG